MSIIVPLAIILLSSILIILSISAIYKRYTKSEYFASQEVYITRLNVINAFNKYLKKTPTSTELKKYSAYCKEDELIRQLRIDHPKTFKDPEHKYKGEPKVSQLNIMTSNVGKMKEKQNQG